MHFCLSSMVDYKCQRMKRLQSEDDGTDIYPLIPAVKLQQHNQIVGKAIMYQRKALQHALLTSVRLGASSLPVICDCHWHTLEINPETLFLHLGNHIYCSSLTTKKKELCLLWHLNKSCGSHIFLYLFDIIIGTHRKINFIQ